MGNRCFGIFWVVRVPESWEVLLNFNIYQIHVLEGLDRFKPHINFQNLCPWGGLRVRDTVPNLICF